LPSKTCSHDADGRADEELIWNAVRQAASDEDAARCGGTDDADHTAEQPSWKERAEQFVRRSSRGPTATHQTGCEEENEGSWHDSNALGRSTEIAAGVEF
jgi:hypothetical protein